MGSWVVNSIPITAILFNWVCNFGQILHFKHCKFKRKCHLTSNFDFIDISWMWLTCLKLVSASPWNRASHENNWIIHLEEEKFNRFQICLQTSLFLLFVCQAVPYFLFIRKKKYKTFWLDSDDVDALSAWSILYCISLCYTKQNFTINFWSSHKSRIHSSSGWLTHIFLSSLFYATDSINYNNVYTPQTISTIIHFGN